MKLKSRSLDKKSSTCLRGIAMILILFHHLSQNICTLRIFSHIGFLCTAIFFTLSGYGLMRSLKTKENYLKNFLTHRLSKLLIPYLLSNLILIIFEIMHGKQFSIFGIFCCITGIILIDSYKWFVILILLEYLIFFFVFKNIKNEKFAILTITCINILFILILYQKNVADYWYNSILCFSIGIFFAKYEESIICCIEKYYYILTALFSGLFIFTFYLYSLTNFQSHIIVCICNILFSISFILIMMNIFLTNKLFYNIGLFSYEAYLLQYLWFLYIPKTNIMIYSIICIVGTLISGYSLKKLYKTIKNNINSCINLLF